MKTAIKNALREIALDAVAELVRQVKETEWTIKVSANQKKEAIDSRPVYNGESIT